MANFLACGCTSKRIFLGSVFLGALSVPFGVHAATDVSVALSSDTTWTSEGSPYVVSSDLIIPAGVTLTVDPGVVVQLGENVSMDVEGALAVEGTAAAPIIFTNASDSSANVGWKQITIGENAQADFSYAHFRYGGQNTPAGSGDFVPPLQGLIVNKGRLTFTDSAIENSILSGGIFSNGTLIFTRSIISGTFDSRVLWLSGTATIVASSFAGDQSILFADGDVTFSGATISKPVELSGASQIHDGGGNTTSILLEWNDELSGVVLPPPPFVNILFGVSVPAETTLTIAPGAIVKSYDPIDVYGTLNVGSSGGATTTLTSRADDGAGGNTNAEQEADGVAVDPATPDYAFAGVIAEEGSSVLVQNTEFRYGGDAYSSYLTAPCEDDWDAPQIGCAAQISNFGGTVRVASSTFSHALHNEFFLDGGTTVITGSRFSDGMQFARIRGGDFVVSSSSITDAAGIINEGSTDADARGNWWGTLSGPQNTDANSSGTGPEVSPHVLFDPWLTADPFAPAPPDPCATPGVCLDNVLFLPGIEGSRLYEGASCSRSGEERLWEPVAPLVQLLLGAGDAKVKNLGLDANGKSVCNDVYTKENDIIDTVAGSDIYQPLIDEMNGLVASSTIKMNAWEPVAYDWRLSLPDLLNGGKNVGGNIYYSEATDTPYIAQELRKLAASSATGKVTIIAHSNGGLVAKALLKELGDTDAADLVDKLILVAVPQAGAPEDVGSLLVGHNAGIYSWGVPVVSNRAARVFAQNAPMAYHLLPSAAYLASIIDEPTHPVVHFSGSAYAKQKAAYGNSLVTQQALDDFLLAAAGDRTQSNDSDLTSAKILNPTLVAYGNATHNALDSWTPPSSIEVDQVAGWGNDTIAGMDFYTGANAQSADVGAAIGQPEYRPIFTEDGDGTVPVPSALLMSTTSPNVKRYWVDLTGSGDTHANIFAFFGVKNLINNLIQGIENSPLYPVSTESPTSSNSKKLIFILHSPLTLSLTDSSGNTTGLSSDGSITQNIPAASYGQFGETQFIIAPQGTQYQLNLVGQASGTFSLDMQEAVGGQVTNSSTIEGVPTTASTLASLTVGDGIETISDLSVDENGDGSSIITVTPKAGDTVVYTAPASLKPSSTRAAGGLGYNPYHTFKEEFAPAPVPKTTTLATTTSQIASTTTVAVIATTSKSMLSPVQNHVSKPALSMVRPQGMQKVSTAAKPEVSTTTVSKTQTAAVYNAVSELSGLTKIAHAFYTGLQGIWMFFTRLL